MGGARRFFLIQEDSLRADVNQIMKPESESPSVSAPSPPPLSAATYRRRAIALAFDFCPPIRPCAQCGNPVVQGYCCTYCRSREA
jgi:hypothetical protein